MTEVPCSPKLEIDGLPYFRRLCEKIRLHRAGKLREDLHANLGLGMDLWTCQFLGVEYAELARQVENGANDEEALAWARENGTPRGELETAWWASYIRNIGFRDHLADRLRERLAESGLADRADLLTMMDYIDADEGR